MYVVVLENELMNMVSILIGNNLFYNIRISSSSYKDVYQICAELKS